MNKNLYRSRQNKMIAGVCGGIAEYFNIDPVIVRLIWVIFSFAYGIGFIAYIAAIIIIPERKTDSFDWNQEQNHNDKQNWHPGEQKASKNYDSTKSRVVLGAALVIIGVLLLGKLFIPWLSMTYMWPLILIGIGVLVIFWGRRDR